MKCFAVVVTLVFFATTANAAELTMHLRTAAGQPVPDAVVTVSVAGGPPVRPAGPYKVVQEGVQFNPVVTIVPVGAEIEFPNHDKVRHHVYSFSPANRFQLKLYGREEKRTVKFPVAGVVALGCNIHDRMSAFVKVVDTPFAARSDASGVVTLKGVPAGAATIRVWHPYLKTPGNEIVRPVTLAAAGLTQDMALDLRAMPAR